MPIRRKDAERAIGDFLLALGQDPGSSELKETPRRVVEAFADELLSGYAVDVSQLLDEGSQATLTAQSGIVVVSDIGVATICPHHLMPAIGTATVAYKPGSRILGLGTIAHLVHAFARRLSLQEQIGTNVVDALVAHGAQGAYCRLCFRHGCLSARGAEEHLAQVMTTATAGEFKTPAGVAELHLALGTPGDSA